MWVDQGTASVDGGSGVSAGTIAAGADGTAEVVHQPFVRYQEGGTLVQYGASYRLL